MGTLINLAQKRLEREIIKDLATANARLTRVLEHYCDHNHLRLYPNGWRCAKCDMPMKR